MTYLVITSTRVQVEGDRSSVGDIVIHEFDTREEAVKYFDSIDLRNMWETEYWCSGGGLSIHITEVAEISVWMKDGRVVETDYYREYGQSDYDAEERHE